MASFHGRSRELVKVLTDKEQEQERKCVEQYCTLNDQVMEMKKNRVFSNEALERTQNLLELNTELHTIWNFRRTILMNLDEWKDTQKRQEILESELEFLLQIIMKNIKSYWMWNHRIWTLESLPNPTWKKELKLVGKMLALDSRNFHGWDYRRFIVSSMIKQVEEDKELVDQIERDEFDYTTEQINKNCTNHSAWHNRSKLLSKIISQEEAKGAEGEKDSLVMANEFDMILNAIYTDPEDQNAWLYHQWLVDIQKTDQDKCKLLRQKIEIIRELLDVDEDGKRPLVELVEGYLMLEKLGQSVTADEKLECVNILEKLMITDNYHTLQYKDMLQYVREKWD